MPEPERLAAHPVPAEFRDLLTPPRRPGEIGRIAHYRVLQVLGRGGMGIVFRAEDKMLQRPVALKVLNREAVRDIVARERFLREGRLAASINHDNIVTIYQVGEDRNVPYLAMELLSGSTLETWLSLNRPTVPQILRLGREVAGGLSAAHARGLIHRDIKPANIWLETPNNRVKLLDFGLARMVRDSTHLTGAGIVVGTPAYISPEQATGKPIDGRGDLFSLGCVLYELCTGRLPFPGHTVLEMLSCLATQVPPPVKALNPQVPDEVSALIAQLLEKNPDHRTPDAATLVRIFQVLEIGGELPRELRPTPRTHSLPAVTPTDRPALSNSRSHPTVTMRASPATSTSMAKPAAPPGSRIYQMATAMAFVGAVAFGAAGYVAWAKRAAGTVIPAGPAVRPASVNRFPPLDPTWAQSLQGKAPTAVFHILLDELKRRNPEFTGSDCSFALSNNLIVKVFLNSDRLSDLTPLRALPDLTNLAVIAGRGKTGTLADLSPLAAMPLTELRINNMPRLTDLRPLKDMPLARLDLSHTAVEDLAPLAAMPLKHLNLSYTRVKLLDDLTNLSLESLDLRSAEVDNYAPLRGSGLRVLNADLSPRRDAGLVQSLKQLEQINGKGPAEFLAGP